MRQKSQLITNLISFGCKITAQKKWKCGEQMGRKYFTEPKRLTYYLKFLFIMIVLHFKWQKEKKNNQWEKIIIIYVKLFQIKAKTNENYVTYSIFNVYKDEKKRLKDFPTDL